jgi:hypothetical protein
VSILFTRLDVQRLAQQLALLDIAQVHSLLKLPVVFKQ